MQRFSENQFRLYEPLIQHAVYVLPSEYFVECPWQGFAQATVSRNLREAIHALHDNPDWSTHVDRVKFMQYFNLLEVGERSGQVVVRIRSRGMRAPNMVPVQCQNVLVLNSPNTALIIALLQAVSTSTLAGLRLVNSPHTREEVMSFVPARADLAIVQDGDSIVIL